MTAQFDDAGVTLRLDPREYAFLHLALSHVLHGVSLADHDFRNILGMEREAAEALFDRLKAQEAIARGAGQHWAVGGPADE